MGKGLYKLFKTVVKEISQYLPILGESGSEVSYFIPDPRNFAEVTRLSYDIKKPWLKANQNYIKNIINNKTFLVQYPEKGEPVTPCMDVYKAKINYDGSLKQLKLGVMIRGDLQNKELVGDTWSPTDFMRTLRYLLVDAVKHNKRVHGLYLLDIFRQRLLIGYL